MTPREATRERVRSIYRRRREAGLCVACGVPVADRVRCAPCRENANERSAKYRQARAEARACPICDAPGERDKPELRVLDATCTRCGWHYTSELCA